MGRKGNPAARAVQQLEHDIRAATRGHRWTAGPWKGYLGILATHDDEEDDVVRVMAEFPWKLHQPSGDIQEVSVGMIAEDRNMTRKEAAETLVELELNGYLTWDVDEQVAHLRT